MKNRFYLLVVFFVCLCNAISACPMCQADGGAKTITAYKIVTVLLTLLPFALGGSIFWYLKRNRQ